MTFALNRALLEGVLKIAEDAGAAILRIYDSPEQVNVITKSDDTPVTAADHAAHDIIIAGLALTTLGLGASTFAQQTIFNTRGTIQSEIGLWQPLAGTGFPMPNLSIIVLASSALAAIASTLWLLNDDRATASASPLKVNRAKLQ